MTSPEHPAAWLPDGLAATIEALGPYGAGLTALMIGGVAGLACGVLLASLYFSRGHRRLGDRFAALSSEALDRNSDRLLALASERLGAVTESNQARLDQKEAAVEALVRPLRDSLARVDEKLQRVETEREGHYRSLTRHLELVATGHQSLARETRGLSEALRSPNARGRWGELQLRRVVELAGMLEHCDFDEQVTLTTNDAGGGSAKGARPDLVVRLPGGRSIVIDAKAPVEAFLAAGEAPDDAGRAAKLAEHAGHVRRHVDHLGARGYWSRLEGSPEFVVLFLPGEPFFSAALAEDPQLLERGVDRKVLLAGPTTLIALLRAVAYGWQQEAMARNAVEVSRLGRELFDRIVALNDRFGALGRKLDGAVEAYNAAIGSLESRVHVSARRMAELGVAKSEGFETAAPVDRRARRPRAERPERLSDDAERSGGQASAESNPVA